MPDEEAPTTESADPGAGRRAPDQDDWLGATADLDWFAPEGAPPRQPRGRRAPSGHATSDGEHFALDPEVRRRRMIAAIALTAVVVVAVVIGLVAFGGGGGKTPPTTPVTTVPTTPVTTTKTTTKATTTTTTTTVSKGLKLVLPAAGKLTLGDTGAEVKTLQTALVKLGSGALTADGNFGAATEKAVAAFQSAHGLTSDGVVGAKTAQAINAALAAA